MPGQVAGDRAFSCPGRPVNGYDDLPGPRCGTGTRLEPVHPRFFVSRLGRAVKPNCLLLPALAPAASAGLRLSPLREGRASGRASLRTALPLRGAAPGLAADLEPPVWPLRWPQADPAGFAERVPEAPLAGRGAGRLLEERAPLPEAEPAWAPSRGPFEPAGAFGVQREDEAGRALPEPAGRESEAGRRAGRPLVDDWAGLRSRA